MITNSEPCRPADIMTPNEARQMLGLGPLSSTPSTNLKPLICDRCYGKINSKTMTCEYCGTKFMKDGANDVITAYSIDGREIASFNHKQAEQRRKDIEQTLMDSKYGIAYLEKENVALKHELEQQRLNSNIIEAFRAVGGCGITL